MNRKTLCELLEINIPLIVAPMAGGPSTSELVATSSEAGALGSVGGAYLSPDKLDQHLEEVFSKTRKSVAVNLFIPAKPVNVDLEALRLGSDALNPYRSEFDLPAVQIVPPYEEDFDRQFEVLLKHKPKVFSFIFGTLDKTYLHELHKRGIAVVGAATTAEEALELEASGVDAIVTQGVEAGGHRAIFDATKDDPGIGVADLVRVIKKKSKVPIIAAGGIMNRHDIAKMFALGADGVQMGTAFLATTEAGTSKPYRDVLLASEGRPTQLTRAFSGRLAHGVRNRFMEEIEANAESILPYPIQNKATREIRQACAKAGRADCLSLWSGSGVGALETGSARDLIERLFS